MHLKLTASDGRERLTDCANTEGILRIVMSVPSPKAESIKVVSSENYLKGLEGGKSENPKE